MSARRTALAKVYDAATSFARSMGLANKAAKAKASGGEKRFANWVGPVNGPVAGSQGANQTWQIQQYQGWCYVAINFIATNFAHSKPSVVRTLGHGEKAKHHYLTTKAMKFGTPLPSPRRFVPGFVMKNAVGAKPQEEEYEYLPQSPLASLLADPNEPEIGYSLWYLGDLFYELTGDCYIYKHRNGAGQVVELWVIPTHWVRPISSGTSRLIDYYLIWPFTSRAMSTSDPDAQRIDVEDMIRIRKPSPFHPIASYSPVQSNAAEIDTYSQITAARYLALQNGMATGAVIQSAPGAEELDDVQMARIEAKLMGHYGGVFNTNRPLILQAGWKYEWAPQGRELEFIQSQEQLRKHVLIGFDLDESYFMSKESTDNNAVELRRKLHSRVLRPRQELWSGMLTERLARDDFGDDLRIIYPHTPERTREEERQDWKLTMDSRAATLNEYRVGFMGLEPREEPEADMILIDPKLIPMESAAVRWEAGDELALNSPEEPGSPDDTKLENEPVKKTAAVVFKTYEAANCEAS